MSETRNRRRGTSHHGGPVYDLHSDTLSTVSEIIWETSGPMSVHRVPPHPAEFDPKARGWFDNCGIYAGYWRAIAQVLTG